MSRQAIRRAMWLLEVILRLAPRSFRERHGREILRVEEERIRAAIDAGERARARRIVRGAALDLIACALGERFGGAAGVLKGMGDGRMEGIIRDFRHGMRTLLRAPGFTFVAVLTIALGIAANTAIFSVVEGVLLRPLPYETGDRLVVVLGEMRARNVTDFPLSPPDFQDLQRGTSSLEELAAIITFTQPLTGEGDPEEVLVAGVTDNFFRTLGLTPALGRDFIPQDVVPGDPAVVPGNPGFLNNSVILSFGLWRQKYGEDPDVIGRIIQLGGTPSEIVGVMPPGVRLLMPAEAQLQDDVEIWSAMRLDYASAPRQNVFLRGLGLMAPGASLNQVQSELDVVAADLRALHSSAETAGTYFDATPLQQDLTASVRPLLVALMGAVAFVLLIACANVGNLFLVRASSRERELAVRSAMGGSRARIFRQVLVEGLLVAGAGGVAGIILARIGVSTLVALAPGNLPRLDEVGLDGRVLVFTMAATLFAALLFGLVPAWHASRTDLAGSLKDRGRAGLRHGQRRLRSVVVVTEVALSLVLLVGAGLMVRSFAALQQVDPGFEAENLMTFRVAAPFAGYPTMESRLALASRLRAQFSAIPGVEAASGGFPFPLDGQLSNGRWGTAEAETDASAFRQADYHFVLPDYFETAGTELIEGRLLNESDQADSSAVVVVDRTLADIAFPDGSAVGGRILVRVVGTEAEWVDIVGVVEPRRHGSLTAPGRETIYFTHHYVGAPAAFTWGVRTGAGGAISPAALRAAVAQVDPDIPIADVRQMTDAVNEAMGPTRFGLVLIGVFGVLALVLASVGLYGVLSYAVRQRAAEFGVRMAFGAERGQILGMVVRQGLLLSGIGIAIGLGMAWTVAGVLDSQLVETTSRDPATFIGIALLFALVSVLASAVPARRATLVDPVASLREE